MAEADRHKPEAERGQYSVIRDTDALTDPLDSARYPLRRLYVRSSRKAEHPRLKREKQLAMIQTALERIQGLLNK